MHTDRRTHTESRIIQTKGLESFTRFFSLLVFFLELCRRTPRIDLEGIVYFETLLLARAIDWLATLSIDPDSEARRGTLSVFSELKAAYSSQKSLHELYFHQHDDKKVLESRIRGAMSDVGERLRRVAVAPSTSAIVNVRTSTLNCRASLLS